ncbi:hypothetical protein AB0C77_31615 [Streptomyces sp. NPDC048629]|uniref:hypothetical protein n=1 Tax=Streptomyces sp. NPDC048629 TaxID=3154824 RepID=UPI00343A59A1
MDTTITLDGADCRLRPTFDSVLRTYSVQLWKGEEPFGIHGLLGDFKFPENVLEGLDDFLGKAGVRELTADEHFQVYAGLVRAKGGPDWALFLVKLNPDD